MIKCGKIVAASLFSGEKVQMRRIRKGGKCMRKLYIDNIRWITVVLVVLYHVIYMFNGIETFGVIGPFFKVQYQDAFLYLVYPWFMLLLFVVSGMSARYALDRQTSREFIRNRTRKLLVPSTLGLLGFWWILGYYNMLMSGALETMAAVPKPVTYVIMAVSGVGPLWYIQMLWVFSVLLIWVRKVEKDRLWKPGEKATVPVLLLLAIAVWAAAQILNTPVIVVYRFGIYGLGFFLGYFIFSHEKVMEKLQNCWLFLLVCALALAVLFTVIYRGKPYAEHSVLDTLLCNLFAWIAVLAALAVMKKWGDFSNAFTRWMSQKSWGLYLFHYLFIAMTAYGLTMYAKNLPVPVIYLCVAAAGFAGAYLAYEIISRIPVLRWLICGMGGNKDVCR